MTLSAKTVKQLRKLEKYILAEPRRFNMRAHGAMVNGRMTSIGHMASRILGLNLDQADRLFYVHSIHPAAAKYAWPEKFDKAYRKASSMKARAKVAVARIEHFIATGGNE